MSLIWPWLSDWSHSVTVIIVDFKCRQMQDGTFCYICNCTCFSNIMMQRDRFTSTNTISKYCLWMMDMFLKHGCFLQQALCQRNNNRKVAITLLPSSHFQMAEITGRSCSHSAVMCMAVRSPTKAIRVWLTIWMWKGIEASWVTSFKTLPLSLRSLLLVGKMAKQFCPWLLI